MIRRSSFFTPSFPPLPYTRSQVFKRELTMWAKYAMKVILQGTRWRTWMLLDGEERVIERVTERKILFIKLPSTIAMLYNI